MNKVIHAVVVLVAGVSAATAGYRELVPRFERSRSPVMVRSIDKATRANLDYALYTANPVRHDPQRPKPQVPAKVTIDKMLFNGAVSEVVATVAQTPLSSAELQSAMAWIPLENNLWEITSDEGWLTIGSSIAGQKWGDTKVFKPFQSIAAVYVHHSAQGPELWVKIEFMPWFTALKGIGDADKDGFREVYARLDLTKVKPESLHKALAWIEQDYLATVLPTEKIVEWVNVLASYWYPTLNTDIVDMAGADSWPVDNTEPHVMAALRGLKVPNPIAVIRGNPSGTPLYNVVVVEGSQQAGAPVPTDAVVRSGAPLAMDTIGAAQLQKNIKQLQAEVAAQGGSYAAWAQKRSAETAALSALLKNTPADQMTLQGKDGWLFFRKSFEYMVGGELTAQPPEKNPLPHLVAFKDYLAAHNVNLLVVPIPTKPEIYYEKLPAKMPADGQVVLNPYGRSLLMQLQQAGVEVVDVLPALLAAKKDDAKAPEPLYQLHDTHWTTRGMQIVATAVASRIKDYRWYSALPTRTFTKRDTTMVRRGDLVDKLPDSLRSRYPSATLRAQQVFTDAGTAYTPQRQGPVLLIGDSFTGVFELIDCKSAGLASHLAAGTGLGVDVMTSWGGGPLIRNKMVRSRKGQFGDTRVVVYVMVARDLYNYSQSWEPLDAEAAR